MSEQTKALGALLITVSDLCDAAEAHGIVAGLPAVELGPLIDAAARLGIHFETTPTLAELHLALEIAAQRLVEQDA